MLSLIEIAEQIETADLKVIQRHQRRQLLLAQRNYDHLAVKFLQPRIDAAAQVLASRVEVTK